MAAAVRSHQRLALIGIVATAATLRVAVVGVGPLLDTLRADVGMSRPVAGLLTTIPYTCMGLFAFAGMRVVARLGYGVLVQACLLVLAIASLVRAVMPSAGLLLLMTVPIGVAVALIGVALPPVVKHRFADRGGQVTGAWVAAMGLGATVAGLTAVPLADALGGWRAALALTAIPPAVAIPLWAWTRAQRIPRPHPAAIPRPPWRTLMPLALVFGLQAVAYTGTIAWSAPLLSQEGFSDVAAGAAPAVISFAALPFALLVPGLSDGRDRRRWIAVSAAVMAAGAFGLAFAPSTAPWLWLAIFAIGDGPLFPLSLTLPLDVARDASEAAVLSMWTLGIGYGLSTLGPVLTGALRDVSGSFTLPIAVLGACVVAAGLIGQRVHPGFGREASLELVERA
jgi:MFS transporter, CP family, cyanate transporter